MQTDHRTTDIAAECRRQTDEMFTFKWQSKDKNEHPFLFKVHSNSGPGSLPEFAILISETTYDLE